MKFLFQLLIFMLPFYVMGQDPDLMPLEEGVENLDFSEVPSGLLWDISPQLIGLDLLDGQNIGNNNRMTINTYGMAYATIFGAAVSDNYLPAAPTAYMTAAENLSSTAPIPITVSAFHYHQMKSTALDDGLFTVTDGKLYDVSNRPESPYEAKTAFFATAVKNISTSQTVSFEIPSNLYLTNFSVGVSSIEIDLGNGYQTVAFDTPISANYGSSFGQKNIAIRFSYNDGTQLLAHTILHVVEPPESDAGVDFRYDFDPSDSIVVSGGKGYIFSVCGVADNKIRKPFFFVEGFNPDLPNIDDFADQTFQHMRNQLDEDLTVNGTNVNLLDVLEDEDYDLIYVDYEDPTASIQDNAAVLTAIINEANSQKAANNSVAENVVFGESMGGLVSKYALLNMENNGIDHQTELLMTFDSPLRGANIPLSMQQLVDDLYVLKIKALFGILAWNLRDFVPQINELGSLIRTPAVRQMLINHIFHFSNINHHEDLMTEIEGFGEPQHFEMFAISNGSVTGVGQLQVDGTTPLMPGDKIVGIDINSSDMSTIVNEFWNIDFGDNLPAQTGDNIVGGVTSLILRFDKFLPLLLGIRLKLKTNLYTMKTVNEKIYDFKMDIKLFGLLAYSKSRNELKADPNRFKLIPLDNAPGGIQGTAPPSGPLFDFAVDEGFLEVNATTFCHIPTVSALDIKSPENENLFQNLLDEQATLDGGLTVVDRYIGSPDAVETSFGVAQNNQRHVVFNDFNARLFVLGLSSGNAISAISNLTSTYNYGEGNQNLPLTVPFRKTSNTIQRNLTISNGGELWVNRLDKIGFINNINNADNASPAHFDLYVRPDYCNEEDVILVRVRNNSKIILGEWETPNNNTANLHLEDRVTLKIEEGGLLEIENSSKLIIESGAEVIIESGGLLDCSWNAQVIVEAGGILRVENNGQLRPSNNGQIWVQPGGQLILDGGAKVQLWAGGGPNAVEDAACNIKLGGPIVDPDNTPDVAELVLNGQFEYSGTGYFDIHPNANIELVGDTNFEIDGYGKGYRFLKLSNGAHLRINKNQCRLRNGEVEYSPGSKISLTAEAIGRFSQMEFTGHPESIGIQANKNRYLYVSDSDFNDFEVGIYAETLTDFYLNENLLVFGSEFTNCDKGIYALNLENIRVWNSSIETNLSSTANVGIELDVVKNCYLVGCRIGGYDNGVHILGATDFVMNGGNIHDCRLGINLWDDATNYLTNSTIDLIGQATLENNLMGIFGVPSATSPAEGPYPMITLDCARLIENVVGIRGRDLLLNMDGGSETAPNVLIENPNWGKSKILELCYYNLDLQGTAIEATNNYWGETPPVIARVIIQSNSPYNFCDMYESDGYTEIAAPNIGSGNIALNFSDHLEEEPTGCGKSGGTVGTGGNDDKIYTPLDPTDEYRRKIAECIAPNKELIYDDYWEAYEAYLSEVEKTSSDHTTSRDAFSPIAQLGEDKEAKYSGFCSMLIEKARSRAGYNIYRNAANKYKKVYDIDGASVYPNPTENLLYLQTEKNIFSKFQIVDVMGTYWLDGNIETDTEETKIEVSLLPPGVYMIYLQSETNRWKSIRFVVSE